MSQVMDSLEQEHLDLSRLLDALERQLTTIEQGGTPDYDIIQGVMDYCLTFPDQHHHPKEDLIYRRLAARDPAAAADIGDLLREHASLGEGTRRLAAAVRNVLDEAEVSRDALLDLAWNFLGQYRRHIAQEDERFFPVARARLKAEDWAAIEAELDHSHDPLFGGTVDQRFANLRQHVLDWDRDEQAAANQAS